MPARTRRPQPHRSLRHKEQARRASGNPLPGGRGPALYGAGRVEALILRCPRAFPTGSATHFVSFLAFPQPYDFELSGPLRAFGPDLANLWVEGGLHRVVGGREVCITAAAGGVDVEPWLDGAEPAVRTLLGASLDLDGFGRFAAGIGSCAPARGALARLPAAARPRPVRGLYLDAAQQVLPRRRSPSRSRLIPRLDGRHQHAYAFQPATGWRPPRRTSSSSAASRDGRPRPSRLPGPLPSSTLTLSGTSPTTR